MKHWHYNPGKKVETAHEAMACPAFERIHQLQNFPNALLYGYSVFTSFKFPILPHWLAAHLERLESNAQALDILLPVNIESLVQDLLLHQDMFSGNALRITLYPDVEHFHELQSGHKPGSLVLSTRNAGMRPRDVTLQAQPFQKMFPQIKHGSLAEPFMMMQSLPEGTSSLWVNALGKVTETTTANVFFRRGDTLFTADPVLDGCLPGITRMQILMLAKYAGITLHERAVTLPEIETMDGCFITNAVQGIRRVEAIRLNAMAEEVVRFAPWEEDDWADLLRNWVEILASGGPAKQ